MNSNEFRKELVEIMPGYDWTVHRKRFQNSNYLSATGIQSSGFNRLSTLYVERMERDSGVEYGVKSSGFGTRAPWLSKHTDGTLARALRGLQNYYETMASNYSSHAGCLRVGREQA